MTGNRSEQPRADLAGAGLVALAAACFGTLGPLSRFAGDAGVDSLTLVTWRAALGAVVVGIFIAVRFAVAGVRPKSLRTLPVRDRWFLGAAIVANMSLNLAAFIAFERITIALTLLVFYLYPAGVALASVLWFGERLDRIRWIALAVSLGGMVLVMAGAGALGRIDPVGIGLAFVAAMAQMFYVLAARHGFANVPGPQAAATTMAGAAALYVLLGLVLGTAGALGSPLSGTDAITPVLLAGVIGAGVPTLAFITGIRRLGPSKAAIIATLEPVVGVGLAAWLLTEQPSPIQLVGGALILGAAVLLQLRPGTTADHEAVAT
ncbi:MAG: DMT family transporter [Chloroflexota bacterium]|nr:DMT family transporter [Chloroflexota bacterium]